MKAGEGKFWDVPDSPMLGDESNTDWFFKIAQQNLLWDTDKLLAFFLTINNFRTPTYLIIYLVGLLVASTASWAKVQVLLGLLYKSHPSGKGKTE